MDTKRSIDSLHDRVRTLPCRRERERAGHVAESVEWSKLTLQQQREHDRARRSAQSFEERESTLQQRWHQDRAKRTAQHFVWKERVQPMRTELLRYTSSGSPHCWLSSFCLVVLLRRVVIMLSLMNLYVLTPHHALYGFCSLKEGSGLCTLQLGMVILMWYRSWKRYYYCWPQSSSWPMCKCCMQWM